MRLPFRVLRQCNPAYHIFLISEKRKSVIIHLEKTLSESSFTLFKHPVQLRARHMPVVNISGHLQLMEYIMHVFIALTAGRQGFVGECMHSAYLSWCHRGLLFRG